MTLKQNGDLQGKGCHHIPAGDRLIINTPGGGGFGPAVETAIYPGTSLLNTVINMRGYRTGLLVTRGFEDIIARIALYRPGPIEGGMVDDYVKVKHGQQEWEPIHPLLSPILAETNGGILYQEQVMRIANELAGFSLSEADTLRRAMGKKKMKLMA